MAEAVLYESKQTTLDVAAIRRDFPILSREVHGKPLIYLDNAASAQKPQAVLDAISGHYAGYYANIHRGVHLLGEQSTEAYEQARETARRFLNANEAAEIIFVRGATEAINLAAASWGRKNLREGDEILISELEHHSNIVPWQLLREETGAKLRVIPINDQGELIFEEFERLLRSKTKIVAVAHISNSLGTVNPVKKIVRLAHEAGAKVLIDGAQAAPHTAIDVQAIDCDFYAFSSHKVFGPSGMGVLYGKRELLDAMPPYQGGGEMIRTVTFEKSTWAPIPHKFEAGTPNIVGATGLRAALEYVMALGHDRIAAHEHDLLAYATSALEQVPGLRIIGTAKQKAAVISFTLENAHPHDVGTILDRQGIAVRAGHHCAQPVMDHFGVPATTRASFAFYNTREEVDALVGGLHRVQEIFSQ